MPLRIRWRRRVTSAVSLETRLHVHVRTLIVIVYGVMAGWLLISAILRAVLLLGSENPLDPLPFISGALGLIALVMLRQSLQRDRDLR